MKTKSQERVARLLPGGVPKYVRIYDNGGTESGGTIDRFTVQFTGRAAGKCAFPYLAMNSAPFHPQGFGQHGEGGRQPCDVNQWGFAPAIGRKNHLGRRIAFAELPPDCRQLVLQDYKSLWAIGGAK